jgi:hypothetical protein
MFYHIHTEIYSLKTCLIYIFVRLLFPTNQIARIVSSRVKKTIRPIRSRVRVSVQSEAISCVTKWLLFTELRNLGMYIINMQKTAWKVLCTVFIYCLLLFIFYRGGVSENLKNRNLENRAQIP